MPIQAIAYSSVAVGGFDVTAAEALAINASVFNKQAGVTGVLLFDGARFLQYIEGPEDGLSVVYSRIVNARSHSNLIELGRGRSSRRNFHYWSMRLVTVDRTQLDHVAHQDWSCFALRPVQAEGTQQHGAEALALVVAGQISLAAQLPA